jgi:predicted RNA-binding Zn ribbon-like protein
VQAIAAHAHEPSILHIGKQAAADAAVRALGRGGLHCSSACGYAVSLPRPVDERSVNVAANRLSGNNAVMDLPDDLELPLRSGEAWWYWLGGRPSLDFVNTLRERWWRNVETLVTPADLARWLQRAELLAPESAARPSRALLQSARELRESIDLALVAVIAGEPVPASALATIDGWLPAAATRETLVRGPRGSPLLRPSAPADPLAHAVGAVALDAARMLGTPEQRERARICASDTCSARFYDRSPTAGRLWCSMRGCGNVAKARRHRERTRQAGP